LLTTSELKYYCEQVAARKARLQQYAEMPKPDLDRPRIPMAKSPPVPGRRAKLMVRRGAPRYEEMAARADRPDADQAEFAWQANGIKVALSWWYGENTKSPSTWKSPADLTASPELSKILNQHFKDAAE
jgi:hypothetical protein